MADVNVEMLRRIAEALHALDVPILYVGGATVGLYLDAYTRSQLRTTLDVDCVVQVSTLAEYHRLEARLRKRGFRDCVDEDAPIGRWTYEGLVVDVMPSDASVLGFANRFCRLGFESAEEREIAQGLCIRTLLPRYLLASKIEAYRARGEKDPYASKDLEDIVALMEGASKLVEQVQADDDEVRSYVAGWAGEFVADPRANDLVAGHAARGPMFEERVGRVLARLHRLSREKTG